MHAVIRIWYSLADTAETNQVFNEPKSMTVDQLNKMIPHGAPSLLLDACSRGFSMCSVSLAAARVAQRREASEHGCACRRLWVVIVPQSLQSQTYDLAW